MCEQPNLGRGAQALCSLLTELHHDGGGLDHAYELPHFLSAAAGDMGGPYQKNLPPSPPSLRNMHRDTVSASRAGVWALARTAQKQL